MIFFKQNKNKAFTLIELLVVIAIIGVLATLSVAAVKIAKTKAKIAKAQNDIDEISKAIRMLANDSGEWPGHKVAHVIASGEGFEYCGEDINGSNCGGRSLSSEGAGLISDDSLNAYSNWSGPYIKSLPIDGWRREYFFDMSYSVDINDEPCVCGGGGCHNVVVVGSYGPDEQGEPSGGPGSYGCDDIIKILQK